MLAIWLWLVIAFLVHLQRTGKDASELSDTNTYGVLLGAFGALVGFLLSSAVNYNYGDAEVAMMFWWLMGTSIALSQDLLSPELERRAKRPINFSRPCRRS